MAEWLYEAGIGEARAALVDGGRLLEMAIEPADGALRAGAVVRGRLVRRGAPGGLSRVLLDGGEEAVLVGPLPPGLGDGAPLTLTVEREALPERDGTKRARVRAADPASPLRAGPDLLARLQAGDVPVRRLAAGAPDLERHGWSESLEEAALGVVAREAALLRLSLTPAMTLIDVDGAGDAAALARAGAALAGAAIRRFGIAGSIGIDLPTMPGKVDRQAAAQALDAALPPPFERTAVNGFGFLQIVRRRVRPSVPELLAADPVGAAARALLARAERAGGHGPLTLAAAPAVVARLEQAPVWREELRRRTGADHRLLPDPTLAISAGHAQRAHP